MIGVILLQSSGYWVMKMSEKSLSFYELECLLGEFIESKGFELHSSIFTATKKAPGAYRYSLVISRKKRELTPMDTVGEILAKREVP